MPSVWLTDDERSLLKGDGPGGAAVKCDLSNQDDNADVKTLSAALTAWKTGKGDGPVRDAINASFGSEGGSRALALARNIPSLVIAADLVGMDDAATKDKFRKLIRAPTTGGPTSVIASHDERPNNWGTHAGCARVAVDLFTGDDADLEKAIVVWKAWLTGEGHSFKWGDLSWQADPKYPQGINRKGATISGQDVDGVLPDDQRRAGGFTWPPPKENYVWEALQGAIPAVTMLARHGIPAHEWGDYAIYRAVTWLYKVCGFPATGDDTWLPHLVNYLYETTFAGGNGTGKNLAFTAWTHAGRTLGQVVPPPDNGGGDPPPDPPPATEQVVTRDEVARLVLDSTQTRSDLDALGVDVDTMTARAREWLGRFK